MKRIWERTAEGEMNVARAMQADADDLLEKFLAAGTSYPIKLILGFGVLDLVSGDQG